MNIPLSRPDVTKEDRKAVVGVLKTPYLALGPKLQEFEEQMASYVGRKYGVAVNSGTSALHLVIRAMGITEGDEVITTPFSFVASANCILFEGATPVFADVDRRTRNIDPGKIEPLITKRTRAILAVDVFGQSADWDTILAIAKKRRLHVIEDSCEALGSEYKGKKCGSFGEGSVFSFYPNKQVTTGEGGMLVTNDANMYAMARSLRSQGRDEQVRIKKQKRGEYKSWLSHVRLGYNYRISEMNCALGVSQLKRIEKTMGKRLRVAKWYNEKLAYNDHIVIPFAASYATKIDWLNYVIELLPRYTQKDRDAIIEKLKKKGIQASNYFPSIHLQQFYKNLGYKKGSLPISEGISERVIALPLYNNLSKTEVTFIADTINNLLK